jgi:hypothetical protein
MKASFSNFGTWAKKTAEDAAGMIETAVKKAEEGVRSAVNRPGGTDTSTVGDRTQTPPDGTAAAAAAASRNKGAAKKTVGAKKAGGSRKPGVGTARPKKTIGKRK